MSHPNSNASISASVKVGEEVYRLLVETVTEYGIFLLDPEGKIATWNQGAERMMGYTASEAIGQNFSVFYPPEEQARRHPQRELAIATEVGRYEEEGWRVRKNGTQFWVNVVITCLKNPAGQTIGFSKVTRDVSDRKAAEDALRMSEEQARLVYESVKDYAIITLDVRGNVTAWNEGARRIKGYESSEIIGKHFSAFYEEEDILNGKCDYELSEAAISGRFEDEGWRVRKDGTRFWANVVLTALYNKNRELRGYSKVTRDMTERKRAEDRLRMANEGLERRVQERTAALSEINEALRNEVLERARAERELQEAVRTREEFLNIASHELRTPITPLKLQLHSLISQLRRGTIASISPEKLERSAATIDRALTRLGKLVDSLLDVARISGGKIELHPEPIELQETVQEICSRYDHEADLNGTKIVCQTLEKIDALIDRTRLEQILANLITNALKYGQGKPIVVRCFARDDHAVLEVEDHGLGISDENKARIFQRFEQVKNEVTTGLGLGLYITKQIIEAQGGTIEVTSELGLGSTFSVQLPLRPKKEIERK